MDYISECTSIMSNNNIIENEDVHIDKISTYSENIIEKIKQLELQNVAPIISELTDAGPGVGVNNLKVKARFADVCMIQDKDRRVRIYRARGDSGQNEAERTNASIEDSLVDGGTMKWNYYEDYDGLSDEQVKEMSISELDMHIETNMEKNAWAVAKQVQLRIDDEKGPGGNYLKCYVTDQEDEQFFLNKPELLQYCSALLLKNYQFQGTFISKTCLSL